MNDSNDAEPSNNNPSSSGIEEDDVIVATSGTGADSGPNGGHVDIGYDIVNAAGDDNNVIDEYHNSNNRASNMSWSSTQSGASSAPPSPAANSIAKKKRQAAASVRKRALDKSRSDAPSPLQSQDCNEGTASLNIGDEASENPEHLDDYDSTAETGEYADDEGGDLETEDSFFFPHSQNNSSSRNAGASISNNANNDDDNNNNNNTNSILITDSIMINDDHYRNENEKYEEDLSPITPVNNNSSSIGTPKFASSSKSRRGSRLRSKLAKRKTNHNLQMWDRKTPENISGLTNEQANKKLVEALEEVLRGASKNSSLGATIGKGFLLCFKNLATIILLLFVLLLLAALIITAVHLSRSNEAEHQMHLDQLIRVAFEFTLFGFVFVFNIALETYEYTLQKRELMNRFRYAIEQFKSKQDTLSGAALNNIIGSCASFPVVNVLRDGKWTSLPSVVLVEGDSIHSNSASCIMNYKNEYKDGYYILQETPIRVNIELCFPPYAKVYQRFMTPVIGDLDTVIKFFTILVFISFFIVIVVNAIRVGVNVGNYDWIYLLLLQPVYTCLFLVPLAIPLVKRIADAVGNGRILSLLDLLKEKERVVTPITTVDGNFDPDSLETDFLDIGKEQCVHLPIKSVMNYTTKLLRGDPSVLARSSNPFVTLGSTTVVCCVDRDGILSDVLYSPEKLLMLISDPSEQQDLERTADKNDNDNMDNNNNDHNSDPTDIDNNNNNDQHDNDDDIRFVATPMVKQQQQQQQRDRTVVLDLINDSSSPNIVRFEDIHWNRYINSLKPLGLNCMVSSTSELMANDTYLSDNNSSLLVKKYLYLLGKEIGFSDSILESFKHRKRLHTIRTKQRETGGHFVESQMTGIIIDDEESGMQLLSQGSPDMILNYCSEYWDGTDIRPLTPEIRQNIEQQYQQWQERRDLVCMAMAYKPIDSRFNSVILEQNDSFGDVVHIVDDATSNNTVDSDVESISTTSINADNSDISVEDLAQLERDEGFRLIQRGQVFIGMIGFRKQVKKNIQRLIEEFSEGGIRFIWFSTADERRTKAFGSKLGLETDWNCCISLEERDDLVLLDESDLKARLPHGIESIKNHIKTVDNVPLLVSLFCDANRDATQQMIAVLQENHEVVCCVGSSMNMENPCIFTQSHVSIAADPVLSWKDLQNISSTPQQDISETMARFTKAASDLTSFPCSLHLSGKNTFPILLHLLREGRRLLANAKQCLYFFVCACFSLNILLLIGVLAFMPPILNGIQVFWLSFIIVPLLSLAMLGSPPQSNIMKLINTKNKLHGKTLLRMFGYFIIRFIPTVIFLLVIFSCSLVWFGHGVEWRHVFGGQISKSIYRTDQFMSALAFSQNVMLFCLVYYLGFLSMSFLHRTESILTFRPYRNIYWVVSFTLSMILQAIFCIVSMAITGKHLGTPSRPRFFLLYLVVPFWPLVTVVIDEITKRHDRKLFNHDQKKLHLLFNTKLGMHSPV